MHDRYFGLRSVLRLLLLLFSAQVAIATPLENLYDVLVFHLKLFHFDREFQAKLGTAISEERAKLEPGQSREFRIRVREAGGPDILAFVGLEAVGVSYLNEVGTRTLPGQPIRISKERLILGVSRPVTREEFMKVLGGGAGQKVRLEYEDYVMAVGSSNHMSGARSTFSVEDVESAPIRIRTATEFVDTLDCAAYAAGDGHVILVSKADSEKYSVFNLTTKKAETYTKGPALRASGNTVYLLSRLGEREYTVVYKGLQEVSVSIGQEVGAGAPIGAYSVEKSSVASAEIWRIPRPDGRFLRDGEKPPYLVWSR